MPKYKVIIMVEYEEMVDAGTADEAARIATDNLPDNDNPTTDVYVTDLEVEVDLTHRQASHSGKR